MHRDIFKLDKAYDDYGHKSYKEYVKKLIIINKRILRQGIDKPYLRKHLSYSKQIKRKVDESE